MNNNLTNLLKILKPKKVADNQYLASNLDRVLPRAFGGQLLAQAVAAVVDTMQTDKILYSCQASFLHPVNPYLESIYKTEILKKGHNFAVGNVNIIQNNSLMFTLTCGFQVQEEYLYHDYTQADLSVKEELIDEDASIDSIPLSPSLAVIRQRFKEMFPFTIKTQYMNNPFNGIEYPAKQCIFIQTDDELSDLDNLLLLNYIADYNVLPTALHPHKKGFLQPGMTTATLNHAQWFHRPCNLQQGIFYFMQSPILINNRALVDGKIFDTNGKLISTTMQEGLVRYREVEQN